MKSNYNKLIGRMIERYGTRGKAAVALGMAKSSLSLKLNGHTDFSRGDILNACRVLDITRDEIPDYFFDFDVEQN